MNRTSSLFLKETMKNLFIYFHNNQNIKTNDNIFFLDKAINTTCKKCSMDYKKCSQMEYELLLDNCMEFNDFIKNEKSLDHSLKL
jgi:hypothetical protein